MAKWQTEQIQRSKFGTQDWCPVFPRWFAPVERTNAEKQEWDVGSHYHRAEADGVNGSGQRWERETGSDSEGGVAEADWRNQGGEIIRDKVFDKVFDEGNR